VAGALVAFVTLPLVYLFGAAAPVRTATSAAIIVLVTALLAGALVPHFQHLASKRAWIVSLTLLAVAGLSAAGERTTSGYSAQQPRPNDIQYTLDADTGQATWLSAAATPDGWTEQFFTDSYTKARAEFSPGYFFGQEFDVITTSAPPITLAAPN
jgi:hypothetical protein